MQYAYITEFCQFDLNEHIVRCRFTEMGVTESYCNSVESSSLLIIFVNIYNAVHIFILSFNYFPIFVLINLFSNKQP